MNVRVLNLLAAVGLVVFCLVVFGQIVQFEFVGYDDILYVTENTMVLKGLTWESVQESLTYMDIAEWQPLTFMSHMLDIELFGMNAGGHHAVSLFWHILNVLLLYALLVRMTRNAICSLAVAILFAIHPYQSEPVSWIASRKDLLYTAFTLGTLILYVEHVVRNSRVAYVCSIIFACLAWTAKPSAIIIPFYLIFLDYWPLERAGRAPAWGRFLRVSALDKVPFAIISCAGFLNTLVAGEVLDVTSASEAWPLHLRVANAATVYLIYLRKIFWPGGFSAFYPHPGVDTSIAIGACAFVALIVITFFAYRLRQTRAYILIGWCWFVVALAPVVGLVPIGTHRMADRYMYFVIVGPAIAIVWSISGIERARMRQIVSIVFTVWLIVLVAGARLQTRTWQNASTLWTHAVQVDSTNAFAWNNLGAYYVDNGNIAEGLPYLQSAVDYAPHWDTAHGNLADALLALARPEDAIGHYDAVLRSNPNEARALNGLGVAYLQLNRPNEARPVLGHLVDQQPKNVEYRYHYGLTFLALADWQKAAVIFEEVLELDPDFHLARTRLDEIRSRIPEIENPNIEN